jgi:hypothetical protein
MHQIILESLRGHIPDALLLNPSTQEKPVAKACPNVLATKEIEYYDNVTFSDEAE